MATTKNAPNAKTRISKMGTSQIESKMNAGKFNAEELAAAKEILAKRKGEAPAEKPTAKAKTDGKKAPAAKKEATLPKEKVAKPKKKSEKIGETKSDIMRRLLREGSTTADIIKHFSDQDITVRYPEIRRNRLWLIEKEKWVDGNTATRGPKKKEKAIAE